MPPIELVVEQDVKDDADVAAFFRYVTWPVSLTSWLTFLADETSIWAANPPPLLPLSLRPACPRHRARPRRLGRQLHLRSSRSPPMTLSTVSRTSVSRMDQHTKRFSEHGQVSSRILTSRLRPSRCRV
jgi:hypothetical protein